MNTDRIQRFITLLETDINNPNGVQFNMNRWARLTHGWDWADNEEDNAIPTNISNIKVDCGTQACALGLAAISGVFKDEGLEWAFSASAGEIEITFESHEGFSAGAAFFDISKSDALTLFDPWKYIQRQSVAAEAEVIRRLRYLLDKGNLNKYFKDNPDAVAP